MIKKYIYIPLSIALIIIGTYWYYLFQYLPNKFTSYLDGSCHPNVTLIENSKEKKKPNEKEFEFKNNENYDESDWNTYCVDTSGKYFMPNFVTTKNPYCKIFICEDRIYINHYTNPPSQTGFEGPYFIP